MGIICKGNVQKPSTPQLTELSTLMLVLLRDAATKEHRKAQSTQILWSQKVGLVGVESVALRRMRVRPSATGEHKMIDYVYCRRF